MSEASKILCLMCFVITSNIRSQTVFSGNGVYDVEGNLNSSIVLGNGQEWMASNLSVTHFADGTEITNCENSQDWSTSEYPCFIAFSNNDLYAYELGYLYNFFTIASDKNICPSGWRVPTELDWSKFSNYLGGLAVAGGKLKSTNSLHWSEPNIGATDEINFSAKAGGCRYNQGFFNNLNTYAFFWTASELDATWAWYRSLKNDSDEMIRNFSKKQSGYSIRCMRDLEAGVVMEDLNQISIAPNPVINQMSILLNDELRKQIIQIKMTDLSGNEIYVANENNDLIELDGLPKGVYFLEIIAQNFNTKKVFIKI